MQFNRKDIPGDTLMSLYKNLLAAQDDRRERCWYFLRQGKISKWFSGIGQEAISVGATLALQAMNGSCHCIETSVYLQRAICRCINYLCNGRATKKDIAKDGKEVFILAVKNIISAE